MRGISAATGEYCQQQRKGRQKSERLDASEYSGRYDWAEKAQSAWANAGLPSHRQMPGHYFFPALPSACPESFLAGAALFQLEPGALWLHLWQVGGLACLPTACFLAAAARLTG
jgi:hypothetical protein